MQPALKFQATTRHGLVRRRLCGGCNWEVRFLPVSPQHNPFLLGFIGNITMSTAPPFDAAQWIALNMFGGTELSNEAITAVASFTMMWNLFEGVACESRANITTFGNLADQVAQFDTPADMMASLDECLAFWTCRYRTPEGFSDRFLRLNFRPNDRQKHVEGVLLGHQTDARSKILALLVIVYRLRNNLFHGLKSIEMLNDQVHNLNMASRCLGLIMNLAHPRLIMHAARTMPQPEVCEA